MAGKKGLKKRVWSEDEKRTICAQTLTPGVSVAQVARRYSMNANLIFKWLKDPRFAPVWRRQHRITPRTADQTITPWFPDHLQWEDSQERQH